MNSIKRQQKPFFRAHVSFAIAASFLLVGCGGQSAGLMSGKNVASQTNAAPVDLLNRGRASAPMSTQSAMAGNGMQPSASTQSQVTALSPAVMMRVKRSLNQRNIARAIRNYRITKGQPVGPYRVMGADLNSNGKGEALVLFTGKGWCAPTGCTLAIFSETDRGYRVISTTRRVKAPILIARSSAYGWRGITVDTGIKDKTLQSVVLPFTGSRYPGNATLMPRIPGRGGDKGELIIGADANPIEPVAVASESAIGQQTVAVSGQATSLNP